MVDLYGFHVGKYTSPMDGMGMDALVFCSTDQTRTPHQPDVCAFRPLRVFYKSSGTRTEAAENREIRTRCDLTGQRYLDRYRPEGKMYVCWVYQ